MAGNELTPGRALEELVRWAAPIDEVETVPAWAAAGRALAEDIASTVDLPAFDNSAMDGYALRFEDLRPGHWLHEIGRANAGHPHAGRVETGTCVRIMTGAPVPDGADTVVMREDVSVDGGIVRVEHVPQRGANIRRRGEHIARGDLVLRAGRHLRAADVALATAVGAAQLTVRRRLRIGVVSTGDELADPPQSLPAAASFDANRPLLQASLGRLGFDVQDLGICRDTPEAFAATLDRASRLRLDAALNVRPGRGIAVARMDNIAGVPMVLLGLPGNAVAAFVVFHLLAGPLLLHLAGAAAAVPLHIPLPLAGEARVRGGRVDYRRARFVSGNDGALRVQPLRDQGSAMLRTVTEADALIALGPRETYADGDLVGTVPLALLD